MATASLNLSSFWAGEQTQNEGLIPWDAINAKKLGNLVAEQIENTLLKVFPDNQLLKDVVLGLSNVSCIEEWETYCKIDSGLHEYDPLTEFNVHFGTFRDWAVRNDVAVIRA